jgi:hypothetical protein
VAELMNQDHEAENCHHRDKGSQKFRHKEGTTTPTELDSKILDSKTTQKM